MSDSQCRRPLRHGLRSDAIDYLKSLLDLLIHLFPPSVPAGGKEEDVPQTTEDLVA